MEKSSRQKICKNIQALKDTLDHVDLTDIYRTFHPKEAKYIFFSSSYGTFSSIEHIWGHKSSFSKFKETEVISSIFSDQNTMGLDINYMKKM